MVSNGLLSSDESLKISRHCSLQISKDELDMMVQIEQWNHTYQKEILSKLCEIVSTKGMYVLLLLDEIDYLLLEALTLYHMDILLDSKQIDYYLDEQQ